MSKKLIKERVSLSVDGELDLTFKYIKSFVKLEIKIRFSHRRKDLKIRMEFFQPNKRVYVCLSERQRHRLG